MKLDSYCSSDTQPSSDSPGADLVGEFETIDRAYVFGDDTDEKVRVAHRPNATLAQILDEEWESSAYLPSDVATTVLVVDEDALLDRDANVY